MSVPRATTTRGGWSLLLLAAACLGCTNRAEPDALHAAPAPALSTTAPPVDRFLIYARNWPREEVQLILTRKPGRSTVVLFRPGRDGHPRFVLDSIGPTPQDVEKVRVMLETFDVWEMNAPNAPGAACQTVNGYRSCNPTSRDYSIVMRVESRGQVRVQRYTGLQRSSSSRSARALGDYVLGWARQLEEQKKRR